MEKAAKKLDPDKQRVNLDLDRKLWRKYRVMLIERGETLTSRLRFLIHRDIDELKSSHTPL